MTTRRLSRAEIVLVGTELVCGQRTDKNGPFLAMELSRAGFEPARITMLPDWRTSVAAEIAEAMDRGPALVCVCGGLGPTSDDVTREAVAEALGVGILIDGAARAQVRGRAARFGDVIDEAIDRQAMVFPGARWYPNGIGVAPGLSIRRGGTTLFLLPGPPDEMQAMFRNAVLPEIAGTGQVRFSRILRTAGLREVAVAEMAETVMSNWQALSVAYLPAPGLVDVVLSSDDGPKLDAAASAVRAALASGVYAEDDRSLEEVVGALLAQRFERVVTAESCTGGLVAELLTSVPGSSRYFPGGVVAYSNELKQSLLGVSRELLDRHGAVSGEAATAMAEGARSRLGAEWAISVTGIAGPDGGTADKPVGLVFHGLAGPAGVEFSRHTLGGDRTAVRTASARLALDLLRRRLTLS
ncbi:MAG: CinA family nicotinamide mononucleotide deamidase-related protein [Candidatus Eisenbacteria bacterium]|jgi:nicotinamide-nucleotide amidase|nr:CinA family nicotinamide mononucleotide deamidase-related protein [Candidatus Eisenbacteria bacterium]